MTADLDLRSELKHELTDFVTRMASLENSFAASEAVMKYGIDFLLRDRPPQWLRMGERRNCFNNAAVYAINREDVSYAEGYAIQPGLPFPVQHAWLVDPTGAVIDPTWTGTPNHVYFGIAFRRDFVLSMLNLSSGQPGILVNLHYLRRRHSAPGAMEQAIRDGATMSHW